MSFFRSLSATLLSAAVSFSLVTGSGCGTNAVGVDECRDIENARCEASEPCGLVDDVPACKRYYRDHCLHGLATAPPAGASVDSCVQVIKAAGACAESDPEARLEDCEPGVPEAQSGLSTACDVVLHPELAAECSFLTDVPPEPEPEGEGGQSGDDEEPEVGGQGGTTGE
jgi:hypothetical protein